MKKLKIYLDTSVIGRYFDNEFKTWTEMFFDKIINGEITGVISEATVKELNYAPDEVKEFLYQLPQNCIEKVEITDEMVSLSNKYINAGIVSQKYRDDALHIAVATVLNIDVLVSWNFKHIVNLQKIRLFNSINLQEGYRLLEIRTPMEVLNE